MLPKELAPDAAVELAQQPQPAQSAASSSRSSSSHQATADVAAADAGQPDVDSSADPGAPAAIGTQPGTQLGSPLAGANSAVARAWPSTLNQPAPAEGELTALSSPQRSSQPGKRGHKPSARAQAAGLHLSSAAVAAAAVRGSTKSGKQPARRRAPQPPQRRQQRRQQVERVVTAAGVLDIVRRFELEADLDQAVDKSLSKDQLANLMTRYKRALKALPRPAQARASNHDPAAAAPMGHEHRYVPTMNLSEAFQFTRHSAKGFMYPALLSMCSIMRKQRDLLHCHLHVVNNFVWWLMVLLNWLLTAQEHLKTDTELQQYQQPTGKSASSPAQWRSRGFYLFDHFTQMKAVLARAIAVKRPMQGWEGTQGILLLLHFGLWSDFLRDNVPGLQELCNSKSSVLTSAQKNVFDKIQLWGSALALVMLLARKPDARLSLDMMEQAMTVLYIVMKDLNDNVMAYSMCGYEHDLLHHSLDEIALWGSLIKFSCWPTELTNVLEKSNTRNHTSRGGGHADREGGLLHALRNMQLMKRHIVKYCGFMELALHMLQSQIQLLGERAQCVEDE